MKEEKGEIADVVSLLLAYLAASFSLASPRAYCILLPIDLVP